MNLDKEYRESLMNKIVAQVEHWPISQLINYIQEDMRDTLNEWQTEELEEYYNGKR